MPEPPRDRDQPDDQRAEEVHGDLGGAQREPLHEHAGRQADDRPAEVGGGGEQADLQRGGVQRADRDQWQGHRGDRGADVADETKPLISGFTSSTHLTSVNVL